MPPRQGEPWNLWDEYPPPLPVEDGLTASGRMDDACGLGASLVRRMLERASPGVATRGRNYARAGQTITLAIERGRLAATVQGSDPAPYDVEISCTVPESDRAGFIAALHRVLPAPITAVPRVPTRELRTELAGLRLLVDAPLTVKCNCSYRGVCKHLVALAYVAGERLDRSPAEVAAMLGITDADLVDPGPNPERAGETEAAVELFDRKRHAQLARTLAGLERRAPGDPDEILGAAARTVTPPRTVAEALGIELDDPSPVGAGSDDPRSDDPRSDDPRSDDPGSDDPGSEGDEEATEDEE